MPFFQDNLKALACILIPVIIVPRAEKEAPIKLEHHTIASLALGAVLYAFTRSLAMSLGCLVGGVLIDLDHWIDYFLNRGIRLDIGEMLHLLSHNLTPKVYILLHSYELLILAWVAAFCYGSPFLWGGVIGFTLHMLLDRWMNPMRIFSYFLVYRAMVGFESDRIRSPGSKGAPVPALREKIRETFRGGSSR